MRDLSESREAELQRSRMTTELIQLTNQSKTEAEEVISAEPTAVSGTSATRVVVPRPTPKNTERAGRWSRWIVFVVVAPFINIAVHVV
jgi:hypothetical protein